MSTTKDNISAPIDMLAALGLQQHPYLHADTARFFYADPGLVQRLDLMQHLIQFGDMLLCISGPLGSGKTTLMEQFLLRGATSWRSCQLNAANLQQDNEILMQLAEGFGLHASTAIERLKTDLVRQIHNIRHNGQLPILVIDDAHLLPDHAIKSLLELTEQPRETLKLLRVALFSEPGLAQRLAAMGWHSPQQPLLHSMDIPSFDEHQTAAYLMYRLAVAGYSGESPFSLTEIRALHKSAAGLPGKLNPLAHETLLENTSRIASRKTISAPKKLRRPQLLLALGALGCVLLAGYLWQLQQGPDHAQSLSPEPVITAEVSPPRAKDSPPAPPTKPVEPPSQEPTEILDETLKNLQDTEIKDKKPVVAGQVSVEPSPPASQDNQSSPILVTDAEPVAPTSPAPAAAASQPASPAVAPAPVTPPATTAPEAATLTEPVAAAEPPATPASEATLSKTESASATPTAPNAADIPPAAKPAPTSVAAVKPAEPDSADDAANTTGKAPEPTPATTTPAASQKADLAELLGAEWLQTRSASRYTLQLLGGRRERALRDFLRQNSIPEPVAIFRTEFKGADWYVLVHGDYPSFAAARSAIASLPAKVRDGKPWARSFATVHADIKKARP